MLEANKAIEIKMTPKLVVHKSGTSFNDFVLTIHVCLRLHVKTFGH